MDVLIRVDAGPTVGLGHLQRCLSLAAALRERGARTTVVTTAEESAIERVRGAGANPVAAAAPLGSREDLQHTLRLARETDARAIIVDSYAATPDHLSRLRDAGLVVVSIVDDAQTQHPSDIVVNAAATARAAADPPGGQVRLTGPAYCILRPEFWSLGRRTVHPEARRVLVTTGGADEHGLTPRLLRALGALPERFSIDAIVGPFAQNRADTLRAAEDLGDRARVSVAPGSVAALMREADLAVCAGGQTLFELAAVGTPAIAVETDANQRQNMASLAAAGVVEPAGTVELPGIVEEAAARASRLASDVARRSAMAAAGQALVDGQGAFRIADELLRVVREDEVRK